MRPAVILSALLGLGACAAPPPAGNKSSVDVASPGASQHVMATSMIGLTKNDLRNEQFCEAVVRHKHLPTPLEAASSPAQKLEHTGFLLKPGTAPLLSPFSSPRSCHSLLHAYDFNEAARILRRMKAPGEVGPFLVGVSADNTDAIIVNLSASSPHEFEAIAAEWERALTTPGDAVTIGANQRKKNWDFDTFAADVSRSLSATAPAAKIARTHDKAGVLPPADL